MLNLQETFNVHETVVSKPLLTIFSKNFRKIAVCFLLVSVVGIEPTSPGCPQALLKTFPLAGSVTVNCNSPLFVR